MYRGLEAARVDNIEKTKAQSIEYKNNDKVNEKYNQLLYSKKETLFFMEETY